MVNGKHIGYLEQVLNRKTLVSHIPVITLLIDVINGVVGGGKASILDVLGDIVGNSTFIERVLENWNATLNDSGKKKAKAQKKRGIGASSLALNMMKMSLRAKHGEL